jgi:protein-tyrosine phosphatase
LGNICRSPFAAQSAMKRLSDMGVSGIVCGSAGIKPSQDGHSPEAARDASARRGLTLEGHEPRALTRELMDESDLVVVMELSQFRLLGELFPNRRDHLFLLPLFDEHANGAYERFNITDPFSRSAQVFEACYNRIDGALTRLISKLPAVPVQPQRLD